MVTPWNNNEIVMYTNVRSVVTLTRVHRYDTNQIFLIAPRNRQTYVR